MIKLAGEVVLERQTTLLGHLIRSSPENMQRKVAFDKDLTRPNQLYKRVGHPRTSWLEDKLDRVFHNLYCPEMFYPQNEDKVKRLIDEYFAYQF